MPSGALDSRGEPAGPSSRPYRPGAQKLLVLTRRPGGYHEGGCQTDQGTDRRRRYLGVDRSLFAAGDAAVSALPEGRLAAVSTATAHISPFAATADIGSHPLSVSSVGHCHGLTTCSSTSRRGAFHRTLSTFVAVLGAVSSTEASPRSSIRSRGPPESWAASRFDGSALRVLVIALAEPLALSVDSSRSSRPSAGRCPVHGDRNRDVVDGRSKERHARSRARDLIRKRARVQGPDRTRRHDPAKRVSGLEIAMPRPSAKARRRRRALPLSGVPRIARPSSSVFFTRRSLSG